MCDADTERGWGKAEALARRKYTQNRSPQAHAWKDTGDLEGLGKKQQLGYSETDKQKNWPGQNLDSFEGHT